MKDVLDFVPMRWQPPVRKGVKARLRTRQEGLHRCFSLGTPLGRAGQCQPVALNTAALGESQQRRAGSDLYVIRVSRKANDLQRPRRKIQMPHCNVEVNAAEAASD